ncbi:MAG TPA: zinc ribbon domain-containing protein [Gemmatimonadaceae bacterium]
MPTYEYKCAACGEVHTRRRRVEDRALPAACDCGGAARVIFSVPRVQNSTASRDSLSSWGRNIRAGGEKSIEQKIAESRRARELAPMPEPTFITREG